MSIVALRKLTLCGRAADRRAALSALQELGAVHLLPLREAGPLEVPDEQERRRADAAFSHLSAAPDLRRPWPPSRTIDLDAVIAEALENKGRLRLLQDRIDALEARVAGLRAFGDFALPPLEDLGGMRLWFYVLPVRHRAALERVDLPWQIVGRTQTRLHVVVIDRTEPPADLLPVPRVHAGSDRLADLDAELEQTRIELERAETAWSELSRNRTALGRRLAEARDEDDLRAALGVTRDEGPVFALQGWVPAASEPALLALAEARGLAVTLEPPRPDEMPPTLLDTSAGVPGSEAITTFYRVPPYRSWDPSLVVFASFAVFFAMILADAGYALLLGVGLALAWRRLGGSAAGRRMRSMGAVLVATALVYGVAAGSYFGAAPDPGSLPGRVAVIDVADVDTMMTVSIAIGAIHVSLANAARARLLWGTPAAWAPLGWIAATAGGLLIWRGAPEPGAVLVAAGVLAVVVGGGAARPVKVPSDWLWRALAGLQGLTRVSTLFGDVLSYMRLFALGLASASLAATFNQLAAQLWSGTPGIGLLLGLLVLLFGHAVNLALGIVSGAVHGLRLNFIEFFGWGLSEEGYPFRAFARRRETP